MAAQTAQGQIREINWQTAEQFSIRKMETMAYFEIHDEDRIYRMHFPEQRNYSKDITPGNQTALGELRRFKADFQRWTRLFASCGQVISNGSWRIDIQSSRYWWALQGPGRPSPVYANATADYDINRFPYIVAAPYVAIALERRWADSFTWHIRVEILEKHKRKRPRADAGRAPGSGRIPQREVKAQIVVKESHHLDANGKFLCWKTIEQVPIKKALGIGTRIRGYLFSEAHGPASEQLWISLGYLEEMWAGLKKLMADQQQLQELLGNMMAHDNVHGALDVGTGSAGVASGGLMAAGFLFPPLFVVGAAVGVASAATSLTAARFDHNNDRANRDKLQDVARLIEGHAEEIQKALESQRQQADIIKFGKKVSQDVNALSSLVSSALEASSALQFSGAANPVKAVMSAVPEIAVLGPAKVQQASAFANVPQAVTQAASIPSTLALYKTYQAVSAELLAAKAVGGGVQVAKGAAVGGSTFLKVAGGVANIAAGGLELGIGINRLVNGSATAHAGGEVIKQLQDYMVETEEIFVGMCAVVAQTYDVDSYMLSQLIDFSFP